MGLHVSNLIEGRGRPVTIRETENCSKALEIMGDYKYSQLPVVNENDKLVGIIFAEGIAKYLKTFKILPDNLLVKVAMAEPTVFLPTADLFRTVLLALENAGAVIIADEDKKPNAIVTNYDAAVYFRQRAENIMLCEEVKSTLKQLILISYAKDAETGPGSRLWEAVQRAVVLPKDYKTFQKETAKFLKDKYGTKDSVTEEETKALFTSFTGANFDERPFEKLTFAEYKLMWFKSPDWNKYSAAIGVPKENLEAMLSEVNRIRNNVAHFRGVTGSDNEILTACKELFDRNFDAIMSAFGASEQVALDIEEQAALSNLAAQDILIRPENEHTENEEEQSGSIQTSAETKLGPHVKLDRWLSNVPPSRNWTWAPFSKLESLLDMKLPNEALENRSWWLNDSSSPHARVWMEVGWLTDIVDLKQEVVRFHRITE